MGLRQMLGLLAGGGSIPIFPIAGAGGGEAAQSLRLDRRARVVDTPRSADLFLVMGELAADLVRPVAALHDLMSQPRATLWCPMGAPSARWKRLFPDITILEDDANVMDEAARLHSRLIRGELASERAALPDHDPNPWRGVGPYGQGGKGMTGGVPYGRPMAGRAPDRDGLDLDALELRVGPFFPALPAGLILRVSLQGDVVQHATVKPGPYRKMRPRAETSVFRRAVTESVPIRQIELARASHHLRWLADTLRVHGLHALGLRILSLARGLAPGDLESVERIRRLLGRAPVLAWATADVGVLPADVVARSAGPVARASGALRDGRLEDDRYVSLGFQPVVQESGDARARWRQRLLEARQSLEIASRVGSATTVPCGIVEGPRGPVGGGESAGHALMEAVPRLIEGLDWGDAVTTILSLDLDVGVSE